jgi:hypothetical protein
MTRAAAWREELGVGQYAQVFAGQSNAFAVISGLTEVDLEKPGIPLRRKRTFKAIGALAGARRTADTDQAAIALPGPSAERRQLTMLFCDLVGATASGIHWRSAATCPPARLAHVHEVIE